jgi:hypothetical protein
VGERPPQLGRRARRPGAGPAQGLHGGLEQCLVALDELDLDLAPGVDGHLLADRLGGDGVVRDDGEHGALAVDERVLGAAGLDPGDRLDRAAAQRGAGEAEQRRGHGADAAARRAADLDPAVAVRRQLEVPAGVRTAGAAPQRGTGVGQPEVVAVEIDGLEPLFGRGVDPGHTRQRREVGHDEARVRVELDLDLEVGSGNLVRHGFPSEGDVGGTVSDEGEHLDATHRMTSVSLPFTGRSPASGAVYVARANRRGCRSPGAPTRGMPGSQAFAGRGAPGKLRV